MDKSSKNNQDKGDNRSGKDRRKFAFGYPGSERRKNKDRRKQSSD